METNTPENVAQDILNKLRMNALWEPAGLGLSYMKVGESQLKLIEQHNTPIAAQAKVRMQHLLDGIGWDIDDSEVSIIDVQNLTPQQQHMKEMQLRVEAAQKWPCPECETPLSAFPLEKGLWNFDGHQDMMLPDGEVEKDVEQWSVIIQCPVCDTQVPMEPYDYTLLAGDDLLMSYRSGNVNYTALSRLQIIEMVDAGLGNVLVLGTFCPTTGLLLPPHVRGSVVIYAPVGEEE
tara:strand:+ start:2376 stop:3077 length:702 start_codon:yes stop_codon:yes gene_type:complete